MTSKSFPWLLAAADTPSSRPVGEKNAEDRAEAFRSVQGGPELQSGEKLLVEAYAAIWLILMGLLLLSWRRQSKLDERLSLLERALAKARERGAGGFR